MGNSFLEKVTLDCWRRAGFSPDMRVVDVGCGSGLSTFLAADLAGQRGRAVGIDRNRDAVKEARRRADDAWIENVEFCEGDADALPSLLAGMAPFDGVIGRMVLFQQPDPVPVLRNLAKLVRPGGFLAFVECETDYAFQHDPSTDQAINWLQQAFRQMGGQTNVATNFPRLFLEAGLGWPGVRTYQGSWGPQQLSLLIADLLPAVDRQTRLWAQQTGLEELAARLDRAAPPTAGAWVRLPSQ